MNGPQAHFLADGRRLHLNHGPIDLIVEAFGAREEIAAAYRQAISRFQTILGELVEELPDLRDPAGPVPRAFRGATARRMEAAVWPFAGQFITPMAAVAGSVADEILAAMLFGRRLDKVYVNNGGDSAFHLAPGATIRLAVAGTGNGFADRITIRAEDDVRGVATSGWRGRSFSLGIADAVTVLASTGAAADAAATIIANAVDLPGHPAITRVPASELAPDSDLGLRLVTQGVGTLAEDEVAIALEAGLAEAERLRRAGLIAGAALFLNGEARVCGGLTVPLVGKVGSQRRDGRLGPGSRTRKTIWEECMPDFPIRKIAVLIEEIRHDGGKPPQQPRLRAAAMALVKNPFAGKYVEELQSAMEDLKPLGLILSDRLIAALGGDPKKIDGYGKGIIVGTAGELEHGALWHVPGGYAMRERLGDAKAIVPSAKKVGAFGSRLDVPIGHINAAYVRSHFDAMEVGISDGPRPDEMLFCLVMTCGPRIHDRMGGLAASDIKAWDGLR